MLDSKYYYENTSGIILSAKGREVIQKALKDNKLRCSACRAEMVLISMNDGDSICCSMKMYEHKSRFSIKFDPKYIKKPSILLIEDGS